jgi:hypothetical protein
MNTCPHCGQELPELQKHFEDEVDRIILSSGKTLVILTDRDPSSPREWDNLGTMVCFHRRYNIGDKHNFSQDELWELVQREDVLSIPIYLMDHSGLSISTGPFGDPWDSGHLGYIFVEYSRIREQFLVSEVTPEIAVQATKNLESEVKVMDQYLRGEAYGYRLFSPEGKEVDSCWGFYGADPAENGMYDSIGEKP